MQKFYWCKMKIRASYNFQALVYFQGASAFSKRSYFQSAHIFKVLIFSKRLYFQSTFIFSNRSYFQSAYISKRLYSIFLSTSKCLFFILNASQRLFFILSSMKQCPIFVSKQILDHISLLFFVLFFNMFQMLVLIMYKTYRF